MEDWLDDNLPEIKDVDLRRLTSNCLPNTLDTTVFFHDADASQVYHSRARPETWIITGDIPAMWLRDSAHQVSAYLPLLSTSNDSSPAFSSLYRLILGVVYTQAACINHHPFSNAFLPPTSPIKASNSDVVHPQPPVPELNDEGCRIGIDVWESKWGLDSIASFLDLSAKLMEVTGRTDPLFNQEWRDAVKLALEVCRLQQRGTDEEAQILGTPWYGPPRHELGQQEPSASASNAFSDHPLNGARGVYRFTRSTRASSETRGLGGLGEPARRCGLIKSAFRPSDDATVLPFLVPSNAFFVCAARRLAELMKDGVLADPPESAFVDAIEQRLRVSAELESLYKELVHLSSSVDTSLKETAIVKLADGEQVYAYEVDGFGSYLLADDANLPSLLSLPLLGFVSPFDTVYMATRRLIFSNRNKWFFKGKEGEGVGGMHIGMGFVWPMSIIVRAMTSDNDEEILDCLNTLKRTTAGTGLMHESFHVDDSRNWTRWWFAWTNGLFGQLIAQLLEEKPFLLK